MSQQSCQLQFVQFKSLFLQVAAITTLSTAIFGILGCIDARSTFATEVEVPSNEAVVFDQSIEDSPPNTSAADLLGKPLEIQLNGLTSFNCLITVAWEEKQFCVEPGGSNQLVDDETWFYRDTDAALNFEPSDRITLFEIQF